MVVFVLFCFFCLVDWLFFYFNIMALEFVIICCYSFFDLVCFQNGVDQLSFSIMNFFHYDFQHTIPAFAF